MPASIKNIRSTIKQRLNKKSGNKTDADPSNKKPPIKDYNQTDSEDSLDDKTIIDTIGSFSDAQSIISMDKSESDDVMFTFKRLNNQGSLKQIKGEKGDGDTKSIKSRTSSLRSKLSFRKKDKKDVKQSKISEMPETKNDEVAKPSSIKSASISNAKDEKAKIGETLLDEQATNGKEDTKSLSSLKESIKSKMSKSSKQSKQKSNDDKDSDTIKGSIKSKMSKSSKESKQKSNDDKDSDTIKGSILSKSRNFTDKEPKEKADDERSSVLSSTNSRAKSETKKSDDRKSVSSMRESLNGKMSIGNKAVKEEDDNKSVASSRKSKLAKGMRGETDDMTMKEDESKLKSNDDAKDTFSFHKIKLNDNMSANVFISTLDSKTVAEEPEPISSQANVASDNTSPNIEPRVIEVVKEETQENFPYSVKLNLNHANEQESPEALAEPKPVLIEQIEPVHAFDVSTHPRLTFDSFGHFYIPTNYCLSPCQYPLVFRELTLENFSDNGITFY
jgi:hypothetical protein